MAEADRAYHECGCGRGLALQRERKGRDECANLAPLAIKDRVGPPR